MFDGYFVEIIVIEGHKHLSFFSTKNNSAHACEEDLRINPRGQWHGNKMDGFG